jgi:hypothetical protein
MHHKTSHVLYAYWNEVRGKRIAPRRFEIEPARIGSVLPETFILERVEDGNYRFRLAGTRIVEMFGTELRGQHFIDFWDDADRKTVTGQLEAVSGQGGVSVLGLEAATADGRSATFEAILLPLVHTTQVIDRIVGAISCTTPPAWLGTERLDVRRLTTHETIWPDGRPHALIAHGLAQMPFLPHTRGARLVRSERRQFRVYDGGLTKGPADDR